MHQGSYSRVITFCQSGRIWPRISAARFSTRYRCRVCSAQVNSISRKGTAFSVATALQAWRPAGEQGLISLFRADRQRQEASADDSHSHPPEYCSVIMIPSRWKFTSAFCPYHPPLSRHLPFQTRPFARQEGYPVPPPMGDTGAFPAASPQSGG